MAREPALNLPNPWAAVGRDTEAGRALFALYNGYGHARSRGNDYSQVNKMKTLKHIVTHGLPEFPVLQPPPPKKPEVKVPHFPHKSYDPDDFHPIDFIPRRRRASEILQQIRDESYIVELPPMPKGPLLDDAEKARLQEVFYWSNRNLGPEPEAEPLQRLPKKGSIAEQELLLNKIATEIEDREAFLTEMESYGKGDQYRSQIMFEIQQRVGQMKLLHDNITQQEKKDNENCKSIKTENPKPQVAYTAPPKNLYARGQGRNANTTALRFNPFIASVPDVDEDPRFCERSSSNFTRQQAAGSTANRWKTNIDTPDSSTPNVIATAACHATTPGDAATTSMADSQAPTPPPSTKFPTKTRMHSNSSSNLDVERSSNSTRGSSTGRWRTTRIDTPDCATPSVIATAACNNGDGAATTSMAESRAATTPPSTKIPSKNSRNLNLNLNLNLGLDFPHNFGRHSSIGGSTAGHSSNGSLAARSPLSRSNDPRGGNSGYMTSAERSNLNANSPPGSFAWNGGCCSPVGELCSRADSPRDYNCNDCDRDDEQCYRPDDEWL